MNNVQQGHVRQIQDEVKKKLILSLGKKNIMELPFVMKVVLNVGIRDAVSDSKVVAKVLQILSAIASQKAVKRLAKKSIAGFKIREGMPIGASVTLRGDRMVDFINKLINVSLPRIRDFHGVSRKFDFDGNYNLGIRDVGIFPEVDFGSISENPFGMNITFAISSSSAADSLALLEAYGMPFAKK